MDLALIFLVVIAGVGIIAYAGFARPKGRTRKSSSGDGGTPTVFPAGDRDGPGGDSGSDSGGGDGGGGGD
jgi:hypothetical protein